MAKEGKRASLRRYLFGSISHKLTASFILIALVLTFAGLVLSYITTNTVLTEVTSGQLNAIAQSRATYIETILTEQMGLVEILSVGLPFTQVFNPNNNHAQKIANANERINRTMRVYPGIHKIDILAANGTVITSSDPATIGADMSADAVFLGGRKGTYVGEISVDSASNEMVMAISTPVFTNDSNSGVLAVYFHDVVYTTVSATSFMGIKDIGRSYLIDNNGKILLYDNGTSHAIPNLTLDTLNSRQCLEHGKNGTKTIDLFETGRMGVFKDNRGVPVIGGHAYIPKLGWCILVETDESDISAIPKATLISSAVSFTIILLFLVSILGFYISRHVSKPIIELQNAARQVEMQNFNARADITTGDELESLANAFNRTAEELGKLEIERKELERLKTEFLLITGHELRSPLTTTRVQAQMLMEGYYGKINKKQNEAAAMIMRNTYRLDAILADISDISKLETARLKFKFIRTDLTQDIRRLAEEMKSFTPENKIEIRTNVGKLPVIEVDPDRVVQVLRNLVRNSILYSKPTGVKIRISAKVEGKHILFSVKDDGTGISPKNKKKLFKPFSRLEKANAGKQDSGLGLGLAICKGIVEAQDGKIWVESKLGKGTTFYFTVPLKPVKKIKPIRLLFHSQ